MEPTSHDASDLYDLYDLYKDDRFPEPGAAALTQLPTTTRTALPTPDGNQARSPHPRH
ncbi:hypothetical protein [Streptomyces sp. NPDC003077]|uniref:hypothetical protein n=1 Tax=Streptomyces sp. NPDC003077 TaxID=3154443 RepID=UPI0033B855B7